VIKQFLGYHPKEEVVADELIACAEQHLALWGRPSYLEEDLPDMYLAIGVLGS
jgi:hypothetical protein